MQQAGLEGRAGKEACLTAQDQATQQGQAGAEVRDVSFAYRLGGDAQAHPRNTSRVSQDNFPQLLASLQGESHTPRVPLLRTRSV